MSPFSLSAGSRAVLCLSLVIFLAGCQVDLYSKLSEAEANEMIAFLQRSAIPATRLAAKDGTITLRIDDANFANAVVLLNEAGLPRHKFATMGDVFADTKLISSPTEERARLVYAISQELSRTLSEIDGVVSARVHLVLPRNDPLRENEKPSSASVFIKYDPEIAVVSLLPQIKTLVTNSVEGLTYEKVSVVFVPAEKRKRPDAIVAPAANVLNLDVAHMSNIYPLSIVVSGVIILLSAFIFLFRSRKAKA